MEEKYNDGGMIRDAAGKKIGYVRSAFDINRWLPLWSSKTPPKNETGEMKKGDRVLVLHGSTTPFYDGKIEIFSDCGQYAKVRDGDSSFASWYPIKQLRGIGIMPIATAVTEAIGAAK